MLARAVSVYDMNIRATGTVTVPAAVTSTTAKNEHVRGRNLLAKQRCIQLEQRCNGEQGCPDSSDEDTDACQEEKSCVHEEFACKCHNGSVLYITESQTCHGSKDCAHGSDEHNYSPTNCTRDEFLCSNGKWTLYRMKCDGQDNCGDGSAETDCRSEGYGEDMIETCSGGKFECASNGQCMQNPTIHS